MSKFGNTHNFGNVFDPIVSVEAWRTKCGVEEMGSVHVDVTFLEAFLGDEVESRVRFRAALKRAVVKIYVSKTDPIKAVRDSVDRGIVKSSELETSEKRKTNSSVSGQIDVSTGPKPVSIKAGAKASAEAEFTNTLKSKETVRSVKIEQHYENDHYCWEITPREGLTLDGKVWDAINEPRLKLLVTSSSAKSSDCEIRLIIECRRQDIDIREIALKGKTLSIATFRNSRNNVVAAEAVIKHLMAERGFSINNFEEPFNNMIITSIPIAED